MQEDWSDDGVMELGRRKGRRGWKTNNVVHDRIMKKTEKKYGEDVAGTESRGK